jgi:hypothetical protein
VEAIVRVPNGRYRTGDVAWAHHWLTDDLCRVTIKGLDRGKVVVAHDVPSCPYFGAPDERLNASQLVDRASADWAAGEVVEGAEELVEPGADQLADAGGAEEQEVGQAE